MYLYNLQIDHRLVYVVGVQSPADSLEPVQRSLAVVKQDGAPGPVQAE
jgi:hypothetical protein